MAAIRNQTTTISLDIGETLVHDLSPIATLTGLERLDIGSNGVASLEPLIEIRQLNWLNLHNSYSFDGSKEHYIFLKEKPWIKVYHGNAFEADYTPDFLYRSYALTKRFARTWELDRVYARISGSANQSK